jgi:hypothetical protein
MELNRFKDDEELRQFFDRYNFLAEDAKRFFGQWDACDSFSWKLIRVVQAQNDLANAVCEVGDGNAPNQMIEDAIAERAAAMKALIADFEEQPRGLNP